MRIEDLIDELRGLVDDGEADMTTGVMLDIAGRWTGIKGLSVDGCTVFIESED